MQPCGRAVDKREKEAASGRHGDVVAQELEAVAVRGEKAIGGAVGVAQDPFPLCDTQRTEHVREPCVNQICDFLASRG